MDAAIWCKIQEIAHHNSLGRIYVPSVTPFSTV